MILINVGKTYFSIDVTDICQMLIAITSIISVYLVRKNNKLDRQSRDKANENAIRNDAYELMRKCAELKMQINGNYGFYVVKRKLWDTVYNLLLRIQDEQQNETENGVLSTRSDNYKKAYQKMLSLIDNNPDIVSIMRSDQNTIVQFDENIFSLNILMISKFSLYDDISTKIDDYIKALEKYSKACSKIVVSPEKDKINASLEHMLKISNFFTDPPSDLSSTHSTDCDETIAIKKRIINDVKDKLSKYINSLINLTYGNLDKLADEANHTYEELEKAISKQFISNSNSENKS